ncbi:MULTISPECIES: flagellar protein FlgN [Pantoea]|jgi:flagella synthesis protein FlgN|uniref:Flagellar protein FlgN n=1 Tax=Pantoea brenneri TaxID=472694 RepID=A0A7Y6NHJ9_9GAMM|nr:MULTISPECIES: flagellar protein FlgN [Pantoea]MBZ6397208.1 flagellar protein FlgN [Pantoea sp.]MBZ6440413.1 flagellar protein FlgN [Pantoea sp.]MDU4127762.1 flagellar protein FlgN [Pantoea sp.]NUY43704.1 flagellar protein FlgN [Pantoea brenneri]NUY51241.1 flagellar protein FlgN [Pantoea brenneri]
MSNAAQCVKMLVQGMIEDRETYTTLKTLLADQRQWLIARDAAQLDLLNPQLMSLYEKLSHNSKVRYQLLTQLGIPVGAPGLRTLFSRLPAQHQSQLNRLWDSLEQIAAECNALNDSNIAVLSMQQEILQNLLNISEPENWLYQQG